MLLGVVGNQRRESTRILNSDFLHLPEKAAGSHLMSCRQLLWIIGLERLENIFLNMLENITSRRSKLAGF